MEGLPRKAALVALLLQHKYPSGGGEISGVLGWQAPARAWLASGAKLLEKKVIACDPCWLSSGRGWEVVGGGGGGTAWLLAGLS